MEEFAVDKELVGLAIGSKGINIKKALKLEGVDSISVKKDTSTFRIIAKV